MEPPCLSRSLRVTPSMSMGDLLGRFDVHPSSTIAMHHSRVITPLWTSILAYIDYFYRCITLLSVPHQLFRRSSNAMKKNNHKRYFESNQHNLDEQRMDDYKYTHLNRWKQIIMIRYNKKIILFRDIKWDNGITIIIPCKQEIQYCSIILSHLATMEYNTITSQTVQLPGDRGANLTAISIKLTPRTLPSLMPWITSC